MPPQREEREIESWLGELRGGPAGQGGQPPRPQQPSAEPTRAMRPGGAGGDEPEGNEPTTAIPVQRPQQAPAGESAEETTKIPTPKSDPESTEKIDTREDEQKRRGGGMSAQDLLRREGRI